MKGCIMQGLFNVRSSNCCNSLFPCCNSMFQLQLYFYVHGKQNITKYVRQDLPQMTES